MYYELNSSNGNDIFSAPLLNASIATIDAKGIQSCLYTNAILTIRAYGYALDSWQIKQAAVLHDFLHLAGEQKLPCQGGLLSCKITTKTTHQVVKLSFNHIEEPYKVIIDHKNIGDFIYYIKKDFRYFFLALAKHNLRLINAY